MTELSVPNRNALINPVLQAVHDLGGSGTNQEIHDKVVSMLQLNDAQVTKPIKPGSSGPTQLAHRLGWARSDLKGIGLLINSTRGVWSLTEKGKFKNEVDGNEVRRAINEMLKQEKQRDEVEQPSDVSVADDDLGGTVDPAEYEWREELFRVLIEMDPKAFERLCKRMLRESGFTHVEVTGRSGDDGIDGIGVMRIGGFLSFKVLFQCKRWKGSIGAGMIRDFRGAMMGRTDKGLIVTTGVFTRAAKDEATRDGAPEIDLVDGDQLIDKLKELSLGVTTKEVVVEEVTIKPDFFANI
ncbi:MAG: restriction endonuclease [Chloroflexota bacterium]|nr:restriction endonuclease [Chloroflexota bacterium]